MGKGNRVRTERADERKAKKEAAKKAAKKAQLSHNITLAAAVIIVVAIIAALVIASVTPTIRKNNLVKSLHSDISVTGASESLNNAEMTYLFNNGYLTFLNQYGQYASAFGLDTTKELRDQECQMSSSEDENKTYTWYDYFMDQAKASAEQLLVLNEEAKARGITLNDEDNASIDSDIESIKTAASEAKMSFDDFIEANYGEGVNEDDLRHCASLQAIASKAYAAVHDEPEYSSDDIAKYCADNMASYYKCDYKSYQFKADYASDADDAAKEAARTKALEKANALAAVADEDAFDAYVKADLEAQYTVIPDDEKSEDSEDKDDENTITKSELESKVSGTLTEGSPYSDTTDLGKWAFEKDGDKYVRNIGDKTVITSSDKDTYTAYYLVKTIYRDEYATKNVRHILISLDSSDKTNGLPDEEAKAKADALLEEFNAGDKNEDTFATLAKENTMDSGSKENGGLYENVKNGDMVTEFNNWIYDESRKAGDTGIVKTTYGYHVMYFIGDGVPAWEASTEDDMRQSDYEKAYDELTEKYAVTYNDGLLSKVAPLSSK